MATLFSLNWNGDRVKARVDESVQESTANIALAILGQAQANIVDNDQVDTGFMVNSGYILTHRGRKSTYDDTDETGEYLRQVSGTGFRERAPEDQLPNGKDAGVAFAAVYAIHQEMANSFLYKAATQVIDEVGGLVSRVDE